jgi:ssDNA-specific exonuclease RecJ
MISEQQLVEQQDATQLPLVCITLPLDSLHVLLEELHFSNNEIERRAEIVMDAINTIESTLIDLDLPTSKEELSILTEETPEYKYVRLDNSDSLLFTTPEEK